MSKFLAAAAALKWVPDDDIVPMEDFDGDAVIGEHAELVRTLRNSGAEILSVPDLLSAAIAHAVERG